MKKIIFILAALNALYLGTTISTMATGSKEKSFRHFFHHAKNVHVFEKSGGITEYDFMKGKQYVSAFIDQSGQLVETDYATTFSELPQNVKNLIRNDYSNSTIVDVTKVVYQDSYFYKIRLEAGGLSYSMAATPDGQVTIGF